MLCKHCGNDDLTEYDCQFICTSCGLVQGSAALNFVDVEKGTQYTPLTKSDNHSKNWKLFKGMFASESSLIIGSMRMLVTEAEALLLKLWPCIKQVSTRNKALYIQTLFYVLYRQRNSCSLSAKQFSRKFSFEPISLLFIRKIEHFLGLSPLSFKADSCVLIEEKVKEISSVCLKTPNTVYNEEILEYSIKLSEVIQQRGWHSSTSADYVSAVVFQSVRIACDYVIHKYEKAKNYRRSAVGYVGNSYFHQENVCKFLCIRRKRAVTLCYSARREFLKLAYNLPLTLPPNVVALQNPCFVVPEIIKFNEFYTEERDIECEGKEVTFLPTNTKRIIIDSVNKYLQEFDVDDEDKKYFEKFNKFDLLKLKRAFHSLTIKELKLDVECNLNIEGYYISSACLMLIKELIVSGCSVEELYTEKYIKLVEQHLDILEDDSDSTLSELTENEEHMYIKSITVF